MTQSLKLGEASTGPKIRRLNRLPIILAIALLWRIFVFLRGSGTRAAEMALRLKYAGVPEDRITVEEDLARALDRAVATGGDDAPLFALPTYTAMLALREELVDRGAAGESFA